MMRRKDSILLHQILIFSLWRQSLCIFPYINQTLSLIYGMGLDISDKFSQHKELHSVLYVFFSEGFHLSPWQCYSPDGFLFVNYAVLIGRYEV